MKQGHVASSKPSSFGISGVLSGHPWRLVLQAKPEPDVLSMMLKQSALYLKECDPLGSTTIMTAVAHLTGPSNPDARAVFCVAHAQLLRNLRSYLSRTGAAPACFREYRSRGCFVWLF